MKSKNQKYQSDIDAIRSQNKELEREGKHTTIESLRARFGLYSPAERCCSFSLPVYTPRYYSLWGDGVCILIIELFSGTTTDC